MIDWKCPQCGYSVSLPDGYANRRVKCSRCGTIGYLERHESQEQEGHKKKKAVTINILEPIPFEKKRKRKKKKRGKEQQSKELDWIAAFIVVALIVGVIIYFASSSQQPNVSSVHEEESNIYKEGKSKLSTVLTTIAVIGGIIGIIIIISGMATRCPFCKKWWAAQHIGTEEIGREGRYETVTRYDRHYGKDGKLIGTTARQEQVYVTYVGLRDYKRCKYCSYCWTADYVKRYEGGAPQVTFKVENEGSPGALSVLPSLEQMWREGVLSDEEWQKAKHLLLEKPEVEQTVTQKIAELYQLRLSGALSEAEFNMKKWDLLSTRW